MVGVAPPIQGEDNGNRMDHHHRKYSCIFHHHGRNYQEQVLVMRNPIQRSKSATSKHQKYQKQLRQKKHNTEQWVLRNVPEHKLYKRKERNDARMSSTGDIF